MRATAYLLAVLLPRCQIAACKQAVARQSWEESQLQSETMKRIGWLYTIVYCVATLGARAEAQCTESGCRPAAVVHGSVVRVTNHTGSNRCHGSGTLVHNDEGRGVILTCGHLFRDGTGRITVRFSDGRTVDGELLAVDQTWDLAALAIVRPGVTPVKIAIDYPEPGEQLESCGYGADGDYRCNRGRTLGYTRTLATQTHETLQMSGCVREGDSGGPVLNRRGELVAVIWGTDGRSVMGTFCGRIRRFLHGVLPVEKKPQRLPEAESANAAGGPPEAGNGSPLFGERLDRISQRLDDLGGRLEEDTRKRGDRQITIGRRFDAVEGSLAALARLPERISGVEQAVTADRLRPVIEELADGMIAARAPSVVDAAIPAILAGLGWTGPPALAAIVGLRVLSGLIRYRRRKNRSGEAARAAGGFRRDEPVGSLPRDDEEAYQFLQLSRLEGRSPLHDALVGRIAFDELDKAIDAKPDGAGADWARALRRKLEDRFNEMAPPALFAKLKAGS